MDKNFVELNLSEMEKGALQEKFTREATKVFENVHDPNTKATDKRFVVITVELKPDEKRQVVTATTSVVSKLAKSNPVETTILTGKDLTTGKIEARELKSNSPGQTYMDIDNGEVKTDVGEPVDVVEKEMEKQNQIIDLQEKRG